VTKLWSLRKRKNIIGRLSCIALPCYPFEATLFLLLIVWSPRQGAIRVISLLRWFVCVSHVKRLMTMSFMSCFWYHVSVHSDWVSFLSTISVKTCTPTCPRRNWTKRAKATFNKRWKWRCKQFSVTRLKTWGWDVDKVRRLLLSNEDRYLIYFWAILFPYSHVIHSISGFSRVSKVSQSQRMSHHSLNTLITLIY